MSPKTIRHAKSRFLVTALIALLLAIFLINLSPASAAAPSAAAPERLKAPHQQNQLPETPYPLVEPTPSPYPFETRPVERNPYLVSGGVLIFAVIMLAMLRYSRRKFPEEET